MKKLIVNIVMFLTVLGAYSQNFNGQAIYQSKTSMDFNFEGRDMPPARVKMIKERMKNAFEKTFVLNFNKTASTYKEEVKLEQPGQTGGFRFAFGGGGDDMYYKNIKEQRYSSKKETFGKIFLVQDTLKKIDWKLSGETKKIGDYTCYKATATHKREERAFRMGPPPREDRKNNEAKDQQNKASAKEVDSTKVTSNSLFDRMEEPKDVVITAWYTMEIPISQGPAHYWGLPGMILEIQDDRTVLLCSKIVINPEESEGVEEPSKGKKVNQATYDEIMEKKMKEMQERFRSNSRSGGGFQVRIGG